MRSLIPALIATLLSSSAIADPTWHTSTIRQVYPLANGDVVLTFMEDSAACASASTPDYFYIRVGLNGVTAEGLKNMLAAALTAASTGKSVSINFDDSNPGCFVNRLSVRFD